MDHIVLDLPVACAAWLMGWNFNATQTILKNNIVLMIVQSLSELSAGSFYMRFFSLLPFLQFCVAVAAKKRYNMIYGNFETKHQYRSADM